MNKHPLCFAYDGAKGLEAIVYLASKWPDIDAFHASKAMFFAEEEHLNRYGRPITGDTLIAMPYGPVPGAMRKTIIGDTGMAGNEEEIDAAIERTGSKHRNIRAKRTPNLDLLSDSDIECLDRGLARLRDANGRVRKFDDISAETHRMKCYRSAVPNGIIDYRDMIQDGLPNRAGLIAELEEFAAYGVLS